MKYEYLIVKVNNEGCIYSTLIRRFARDAHKVANVGDRVYKCKQDSCYYNGFEWMSDKVIRSYRKGKNNSRIWLQAENESKIVPDWWERDIEAEQDCIKEGIV